MPTVPIIASVRDFRERYPIWLCDIWGVLHNGVAAYPEASKALQQFRATGGTVILVTNAPRPNMAIAEQIAKLGVPANAYDAIVTSGDVTRTLIAAEARHGIYHLGPAHDRVLFEGLGVRLCDQEEAGAVVCTGLFDDRTETPETYRPMLARLGEKSLPMICANPDIVVERGSEICYCAGAIGQAYEQAGGKVAYAGKPKAPIYSAAVSAAVRLCGRTVDKRELLAIGDGLRTDMLGAFDFGIDALFVASGIHLDPAAGLTQAGITELFAVSSSRPVAAIARLAW
jgi:HAD superfamily hydrolase (TIGR01459 family)